MFERKKMSSNLKRIADLRVDYTLKSFNEEDLIANPFAQFANWLDEAIEAKVNEPNAMTLATVKPNGSPSARIVLLKGFDETGFVFFTNYESTKGQELNQNPHTALVFCWFELQRQVRIEGTTTKISAAESDEYFHSRPFGSKIGAHASPQSTPISGREELEKRYLHFEELFSKEPLMRPEHWGGYRVKPSIIEFWQGRQSRLHDRFRYTIDDNNSWKHNRLAP
jgi:pyridoxamine 5'-phosphate oxidase